MDENDSWNLMLLGACVMVERFLHLAVEDVTLAAQVELSNRVIAEVIKEEKILDAANVCAAQMVCLFFRELCK